MVAMQQPSTAVARANAWYDPMPLGGRLIY